MFRTSLYKILLVFLLSISASVQAGTFYSQLYVFGDSLSDTGNLSSVVGNLPPPYYMNRASNGPVAVDILAAKLGLNADASLHLAGPEMGGNYAIATAKASDTRQQDLTAQLIGFYSNHGYAAPADALYVIFIGGNDIRATRHIPDLTTSSLLVHAAVLSVKNTILSLAQSGAKNFLLINSPNTALLPEIKLLTEINNDPGLLERSFLLSQLYQNQLHMMAAELRESGILEIKEFDLFKFFNKLVRKADHYGFSNATDACFYRETLSFHPDCPFAINANQFVFFDEVHPTAHTHQLIGEALYKKVIDD